MPIALAGKLGCDWTAIVKRLRDCECMYVPVQACADVCTARVPQGNTFELPSACVDLQA
jgi:hypothetical protein